VIVGETITIGWDELSSRKRERLKKALSFVTKNNDVMTCYREIPGAQIEIPRGAWDLVGQLDYVDRRRRPPAPKLQFDVELDRTDLDPRFAGQSDCIETMLQEEQGIILRPPGTGKTQIALGFAAVCQTPVLVLVHTKDILDQWVSYAQDALPGTKVGVVQGKRDTFGQITIGMIQTLRTFYADGTHGQEWFRKFGAVILDEAHHGAARSFETVLNWMPAFYRFGFTATDKRADGMHPYLVHLIGPVIHKQKFSSPIETRIVPVYTNFNFRYRGRFDWHPLLDALVTDERRNRQIADIVDRECEHGNSVLVLSRRIEQLERIAEQLDCENEILIADRGRTERRRILNEFRAGRIRCVLATQLADEALDVPRCNRVVLVHPGKFEGRITQQIGRAIRKFEGKRDAAIYDVVDKRVGVLNKQWSERKHAYKTMRIPIQKHRLLGGRRAA